MLQFFTGIFPSKFDCSRAIMLHRYCLSTELSSDINNKKYFVSTASATPNKSMFIDCKWSKKKYLPVRKIRVGKQVLAKISKSNYWCMSVKSTIIVVFGDSKSSTEIKLTRPGIFFSIEMVESFLSTILHY